MLGSCWHSRCLGHCRAVELGRLGLNLCYLLLALELSEDPTHPEHRISLQKRKGIRERSLLPSSLTQAFQRCSTDHDGVERRLSQWVQETES